MINLRKVKKIKDVLQVQRKYFDKIQFSSVNTYSIKSNLRKDKKIKDVFNGYFVSNIEVLDGYYEQYTPCIIYKKHWAKST